MKNNHEYKTPEDKEVVKINMNQNKNKNENKNKNKNKHFLNHNHLKHFKDPSQDKHSHRNF